MSYLRRSRPRPGVVASAAAQLALLVACAGDPPAAGNPGGASGGGAPANTGGAAADTGGANANVAGMSTPGTSASGAAGAGPVVGTAGNSGAGAGTAGSGGQLPSTGCGAMSPPASGTYTIDVGGTPREYILTLPEDYDPSRPYPVIFGWHPLGGSAEGVAEDGFGFLGGYYGLEQRANGSVIFVAGQGLPNQQGQRGWPNTDGRDIAFLEAMLTRFETELCIDQSRLLSTGFSFGGMMSDLIACQLGRTFRAIAPMAGTLITSYQTCVDEPVAALIIHGTTDDPVPIMGGAQFRDYLIETNGCQSSSMPAEPSPCVAYAGCSAGYPVTWCEWNGGHNVPDFSSDAIWSFFSQFL